MAKYLKGCFDGVFSSKLKMVAGVFYIPKNRLLNPLGEDANFVFEEKQTIGVADGVGSRSLEEVNKYACKLMENSVMALHDEPNRKANPKRVLYKAHSKTKVKRSSTACIVTIRGCQLHAVNVGDSGFMLFRDKELVYQSPVQQHSFNCPFQLRNGIGTLKMCKEIKEIKREVKAGDIVVLGTDGLFDNMYASQIEKVLKENTMKGVSPEQLARTLAEIALHNSREKYSISPFAKAARKAGHNYKGGKEDDITVIVGFIESTN